MIDFGLDKGEYGDEARWAVRFRVFLLPMARMRKPDPFGPYGGDPHVFAGRCQNRLGGVRYDLRDHQGRYGVHLHEEGRLRVQRRTLPPSGRAVRGLPKDHGASHREVLPFLSRAPTQMEPGDMPFGDSRQARVPGERPKDKPPQGLQARYHQQGVKLSPCLDHPMGPSKGPIAFLAPPFSHRLSDCRAFRLAGCHTFSLLSVDRSSALIVSRPILHSYPFA